MTIDLRKLQQDLRDAADALTPLIEAGSRPLFDFIGSSAPAMSGSSARSRLSEAARARIAEANRKFWVPCLRPECSGKRHRATHPHIKGAKGKRKTA